MCDCLVLIYLYKHNGKFVVKNLQILKLTVGEVTTEKYIATCETGTPRYEAAVGKYLATARYLSQTTRYTYKNGSTFFTETVIYQCLTTYTISDKAYLCASSYIYHLFCTNTG